jgi:hypothetical protein
MRVYTIVVPGCPDGVWADEYGLGLRICWILAAHTAQQGPANVWGTANVSNVPGQANGAATAGNAFLFSDVGLYLDINGDGVPPPWEMPEPASEFIRCLRYYQRLEHHQTAFSTTPGTVYAYSTPLPVTMRTTPASAVAVAGTFANGATATTLGVNGATAVLGLTTPTASVTFSVSSRVYSLNARL